MSEAERAQNLNDQLRREANIERTKVSLTSKQLVNYVTSEPDPLVEGIRKQDNPFIKKSTCTIL